MSAQARYAGPVSGPSWFIALPVRRDDAERWLRSVPAPPAGFRLLPAADLHVTVAFFGAVSAERARAGWDALALALAPVAATVGPLVALGNPRRYSALGARLGEGRELVEAAIGAAREAPIRAAGAEPEARPPLAHVTLARPPRSAGPRERSAGLDWAAKVPLGAALHLDAVALYTRSNEAPPAPRYRAVLTRALAP